MYAPCTNVLLGAVISTKPLRPVVILPTELLLLLASVLYLFRFTYFFMIVVFFTLVDWAGGQRGGTRNAQMHYFVFSLP